MSRYKIYVYAICKNEEKFADRWMDSMGEADGVIVTDTGSDDGTVERLRRRGAVVYIDEVRPWRFDKARNISLDHVPGDADICVCTDLDEVFEKDWRDKLENAWTPEAKSGKYIYNWSLKPDGSPDVQIYYSKIHTRHDFRFLSAYAVFSAPAVPRRPVYREYAGGGRDDVQQRQYPRIRNDSVKVCQAKFAYQPFKRGGRREERSARVYVMSNQQAAYDDRCKAKGAVRPYRTSGEIAVQRYWKRS